MIRAHGQPRPIPSDPAPLGARIAENVSAGEVLGCTSATIGAPFVTADTVITAR